MDTFSSNLKETAEALHKYQSKYLTEYMNQRIGALTELEKAVLNSLSERTTLTDKLDDEEDTSLSFGQWLSDKVAAFGGSWVFILSFGCFILVWITANTFFLLNKGFDPYPYILLNLILSCIAALQAPIIMMSQNRQEEKDRNRAKKDYMINLKSELEIRILHEKMDQLIIRQQQELLDIQQVQIELMNTILKQVGNNHPSPNV